MREPDVGREPAGTDAGGPVLVLIPVYNDWPSLGLLLDALDGVLAAAGREAAVLVVDDGSAVGPGPALQSRGFAALTRVDVLELRRNVGHQRAIAVGLAYVRDHVPCSAVVVMDGDGEDDPRDVPRLLDAYRREGGEKIIFAERTRRSESLGFRVGYAAYRAAHRVLTGQRVRVGNFSVIPRARLDSLVVVSELWNHYAAAAFKSRQPSGTIPTHRAARLAGRSSMNFVSLVVHGLSAISVYADVVGVRLLVAALTMIGLTLVGVAAAVFVRVATDLAIPGWATFTVGILLILLAQGVMFAFLISFVILGGRQGTTVLPCRDYAHFVGRVRPLARPGAVAAPAAPAAVAATAPSGTTP